MFLILFSRRMRGARKAVGKRMTCPDFIHGTDGREAYKARENQTQAQVKKTKNAAKGSAFCGECDRLWMWQADRDRSACYPGRKGSEVRGGRTEQSREEVACRRTASCRDRERSFLYDAGREMFFAAVCRGSGRVCGAGRQCTGIRRIGRRKQGGRRLPKIRRNNGSGRGRTRRAV